LCHKRRLRSDRQADWGQLLALMLVSGRATAWRKGGTGSPEECMGGEPGESLPIMPILHKISLNDDDK